MSSFVLKEWSSPCPLCWVRLKKHLILALLIRNIAFSLYIASKNKGWSEGTLLFREFRWLMKSGDLLFLSRNVSLMADSATVRPPAGIPWWPLAGQNRPPTARSLVRNSLLDCDTPSISVSIINLPFTFTLVEFLLAHFHSPLQWLGRVISSSYPSIENWIRRTWASSALIILFSEMCQFSKNTLFSEKQFWREIKKRIEYLGICNLLKLW